MIERSTYGFLFQAEDGIRYRTVTGVQRCALPICRPGAGRAGDRGTTPDPGTAGGPGKQRPRAGPRPVMGPPARGEGPGSRRRSPPPGAAQYGGLRPAGLRQDSPPSGRPRPGSPRRVGPGRDGAMPGARARRGGIQRASPARRLRVGLLCAGIALSLIAGRLIQLQGLDVARYRALAERQRLHSISVPAERGSITTADGTILAMTVQTDTVTADPTQIREGTPTRTAALRQRVADALAGPLAMPSATILHLLNHPSSRRYVLLAKGISLSAAGQVTARMNKLNAVGIYLTPAYTREYPNGDLAAG